MYMVAGMTCQLGMAGVTFLINFRGCGVSRTFKPLALLFSLALSLFQVDLCLTFATGFMLGQSLLGVALLIIAEGLNVTLVESATLKWCMV